MVVPPFFISQETPLESPVMRDMAGIKKGLSAAPDKDILDGGMEVGLWYKGIMRLS